MKTMDFKPQAVLKAWLPFKHSMGVTSVTSKTTHEKALKAIEALIEAIGDDESHPLAEVLDYLGVQVELYENEKFPIPDTEPREALRFLMEQQGIGQSDLSDCAPQGRISDILHGKRGISKAIAKKLARRLHVSAEVFL